MITEFLLGLGLLYLFYLYLKPQIPPNFPPGPANYPIVGGTLILSKLGRITTDAYRKLGEIYGPITGIFLGNFRAVIINGYEATREFYALDQFAHRPFVYLVNHRWGSGPSLGIFFSNGRLWKEQRRWTLRHLRDFGFGKTTMEGLIHGEVNQCLDNLTKCIKENPENQGVIPDIHNMFGVSLINILWAIVAGKRYKYEDLEFQKMLQTIQISFRAGSPSLNLVNAYPWIRHLPYFKQQFKILVAGNDAVLKMLEVCIGEHEATFKAENKPRDLIDVYLKEMEERKDEPDSTFFKEQLLQICADLFPAGSESTSNSIAFFLLHMIRHPKIQKRMQEELDQIVGRSRLPSWNDRDSLPYTMAVLTEVFRVSPVAPISVGHQNPLEDVNFRGYNLPKGTLAFVNFTSTNMDPVLWGDPQNFRPERFLTEKGEFSREKLDHVLGFGAGKRKCIGEPLARISNFLFCTGLLQKFRFEVVPGTGLPEVEPVDGFTVGPQPFSAKVTLRK